MHLMDAWTNTFAVPGTRTTGNKAGSFAIIGPRWQDHLPRDITALRSPTNMVWLAGRIQTNTASDYASLRGLQDQLRLTPLSAWGKPTKPAEPVAKPDGTSRREHETAAAIGGLPGAVVALARFGSSDCGCETHLFWFAELPPMPPVDILVWNR
jgi:hypothetical protein